MELEFNPEAFDKMSMIEKTEYLREFFPEVKLNHIYNEDCIEGMKKLPDNLCKIAITSPPYNVGESIRGNFYDEYEDNLPQEQYSVFIEMVLKELIRVTEYYVFFNFQMLSGNRHAYIDILHKFKNNIKEIIIWHKKQVQPAVQPTCLSSTFEFIVVFAKPELAQKRSFEYAFFNNREKGQLNTNVIYGDCSSVKEFNDDKGGNKAVFPQYFVREFLDKFTKKGDLVLDSFMGSGTTALVCQQKGRNFIGFELSEEYVKTALKRLRQTTLLEVL